MVSLFAFIVTLGLVVDDAIVGENITVPEKGDLLKISGGPSNVRSRDICSPYDRDSFSPLLLVPGSLENAKLIPVVVIAMILSLIELLFYPLMAMKDKPPGRIRRSLMPRICFLNG